MGKFTEGQVVKVFFITPTTEQLLDTALVKLVDSRAVHVVHKTVTGEKECTAFDALSGQKVVARGRYYEIRNA